MEKQLIITVSREFGSGGFAIAEKLAGHYGIQLLDHNLLEEIALEKGVDVDGIRSLDETHKNPFTSRRVKGLSNSPAENVYLLQFDYLQKKAENGDSFVLVGRCGENILKDYDGLVSVFILGDKEVKLKRIMESYQMKESLAKKMIFEKDTKRKRYHNSFCEGKWGDSRNYDISINSSKLGIDGTVAVLIDFIDRARS